MISRRLLRIKVLQIMYAFSKKDDYSTTKAEKELFYSIEKFYDLYHLLLLLLVEIAKMEENNFELVKNKLYNTNKIYPNKKLSDNKILQCIKKNENLEDSAKERKLNWNKNDYIIKSLYNDFINSEAFVKYSESDNVTQKDDKDLIVYFYSEFLAENEKFIEFLEEESIYWIDDFNFALVIVLKTLQSVKTESENSTKLLPLFKNENDKEFAKNLLKKTIINSETNIKIIEKYAKNWDTERIAQIDLLILQLAITEVLEFPSIPIKVTFNEFIEISKYYSTSKSKIFINGLLDKIIKDFKIEKKINKAGRGLVGD